MGVDLVVDERALEHAALTLRLAAHHLAESRVARALADAPGALPATDTAAACADLGRRLAAAVLAQADSLAATSDAVLDAARTYRLTDARLTARAAAATGGPG